MFGLIWSLILGSALNDELDEAEERKSALAEDTEPDETNTES